MFLFEYSFAPYFYNPLLAWSIFSLLATRQLKKISLNLPVNHSPSFSSSFCGWNSDFFYKDSDDLEVGRESPEPKLGFLGSKWSRLIGWVLVGIYAWLGCSCNLQFVGVTWLVLRCDWFCLITDLCYYSLYTQYTCCQFPFNWRLSSSSHLKKEDKEEFCPKFPTFQSCFNYVSIGCLPRALPTSKDLFDPLEALKDSPFLYCQGFQMRALWKSWNSGVFGVSAIYPIYGAKEK